MASNRGKRKEITFKDDEWEVVEKKASEANLDTTNYIRRMSLNGYIIDYNLNKINDLIYELNKIGVNINQLARKANEIDNIYKSDIEELEERMDKLWHLLKSYLLELQ